MASQTILQLTDDTDGGPADETLKFALDGRDYEIDLSDANAQALRDLLTPYAAAGRRVSGRRGRPVTRVETGVDTAAVRAWAASHGLELSARGRLPKHVVEKYPRRRQLTLGLGACAGDGRAVRGERGTYLPEVRKDRHRHRRDLRDLSDTDRGESRFGQRRSLSASQVSW
jgi:hypothetical protein